MRNTVDFLNRFWRDRSGAAAEYAVILAIVGSALVVSFLVLSGALAGGIDDATSCIDRTTCF
jgi:Flp pilus assembly pilin Flp